VWLVSVISATLLPSTKAEIREPWKLSARSCQEPTPIGFVVPSARVAPFPC